MFWMVWVPGKGAPKKLYSSLEDAKAAVSSLKRAGTGREIHILSPVYTEPGRKLLTVKKGQGLYHVKVEAAQEQS